MSRPVLQYGHCLLRLQGIILSVKISLHFTMKKISKAVGAPPGRARFRTVVVTMIMTCTCVYVVWAGP